MANSQTSKPFGLSPWRYRNGTPWNGSVNLYYVPSTDSSVISVGDVVKLAAATTTAVDPNGMRSIAKAAAGDNPLGVVVGFSPTFPGYAATTLAGAALSLEKPWRQASTAGYLWICDDPDVVFKAQMKAGTLSGSNSLATTLALNCDIAVTAGTFISGTQLDSNTVATTNTLKLKLLGMVEGPENSGITDMTSTDGSNAIFAVMFNVHQLGRATGIAGV